MAPVTDQTLRRAIGVMGTLLVVVLGATALVMLSRGGSGGSASVTASPSASRGAAASRSASPSAAPSISTPPSLAPSAAPSPSPTPVPVPTATLTFLALRLDATDDPAGQDRVITFTSDGPSTMSVRLVSRSSKGTTHMCFRVGAKELGCKDWSKGTFNGKTSQAHTNWRVTIRGSGTATPVVDVTVTYQAVAPKVKIAHARFNGTADPGLNGIGVHIVPRAGGDARIEASWGGHPFLYEIDTSNETTGQHGPSYPDQGPATKVDQATAVTAGDTWWLGLRNLETGFGTTDLTATVSWP